MTENGIFEEYLRIRDGVRYLSGGREYSRAETEELLRSPDPFERVRAWEMLRGGWAGLEAVLAGLLGRVLAANKARCAAGIFGEASGPLLEAAASLRPALVKALELKAGRVGSSGLRCSDLVARLPAPAEAQMPLAEGLRRLALIFEERVEGGRGLIMEFFPGNRLRLEGDIPRCVRPDGSSPASLSIPETFRGVYPSDLPEIARELGRAVHFDLSARLCGGTVILPVFGDLLANFFEEAAWSGLRAGADPRAAAELAFDRLPRLAEDFLMVPAELEFAEAAAAAGEELTPEAAMELEKRVFAKWLGPEAAGAGYWMRAEVLFGPEPFGGFARLAGRLLSSGLAPAGVRLSAAALEGAVADAGSLCLTSWLSGRAPGGWPALAAGALGGLSGLD